MDSYMVYRASVDGKEYVGLTPLPLEERKRSLIEQPVTCLKDEHLSKLQIQACFSNRVEFQKGLALEAAFAALAYRENNEARGGPWCWPRPDASMKHELSEVVRALKSGASLASLARSVEAVALTLPRTGALNRHLHFECFKCGHRWKVCPCRGYFWLDSGYVAPKRDRSAEITARRRRGRKRESANRGPRIRGDRSLESVGRRQPQSLKKRPSGAPTSDTRSGSQRREAAEHRNSIYKSRKTGLQLTPTRLFSFAGGSRAYVSYNRS